MRLKNDPHQSRSKSPVTIDDSENLFIVFVAATSVSILAMVCGIALALA